MVEIELKSKDFKEYVHLKINKDKHMPIFDEDVENIKDITMNGLDFIDEPTDVTLFDLVFFKNVEICTFINMNISAKEIDVLNNMKKVKFIQFTNCVLPKEKKLQLNTESIVFDKCHVVEVENIESVPDLKSLRIVNCENVKTKGIANLKKLTHLYMQNLDLDDISEIESLQTLKYLNLNGTKVKNMGNILKNKELKVVHEAVNYIFDVDEEGV